jgi:hypothetical protein
MAAGCSAESGAPDEAAEIGSSAEALSISVAGKDALPSARIGAASCVVHDDFTHADTNGGASTAHNRDLILVAAGKTTAGSYLRSAVLFDPAKTATNQWLTSGPFVAPSFGSAASDEVASAKMIAVPGDNHSCLLIGGEKNGTKSAKTWKFTLDASGGTWSSSFNLNDARQDFGLSKCTNNKVIVYGGEGTSGPLDSIEVWNGTTTWTSRTAANSAERLGGSGSSRPRTRFGYSIDVDPTGTPAYAVALGGFDGSGESKRGDLIVFDANCTSVTVTHNASALSLSGTDYTRMNHVAFPINTNVFLVAAGLSGGSTVTSTEEVTVTLGMTPTIAMTAHNTSGSKLLPTATQKPILAFAGATNKYAVIGGDDNQSGVNLDTITAVQEYSAGFSSVTGTSRRNSVAELLSGKVYSIGGEAVASGVASDQLATDEITP